MTDTRTQPNDDLRGHLIVMGVVAVAIALRSLSIGGGEMLRDLAGTPTAIEAEQDASYPESKVGVSLSTVESTAFN